VVLCLHICRYRAIEAACTTAAISTEACIRCGKDSDNRELLPCAGCMLPLFCSTSCRKDAFESGVVHSVYYFYLLSSMACFS
jgi:hypothetical protein